MRNTVLYETSICKHLTISKIVAHPTVVIQILYCLSSNFVSSTWLTLQNMPNTLQIKAVVTTLHSTSFDYRDSKHKKCITNKEEARCLLPHIKHIYNCDVWWQRDHTYIKSWHTWCIFPTGVKRVEFTHTRLKDKSSFQTQKTQNLLNFSQHKEFLLKI